MNRDPIDIAIDAWERSCGFELLLNGKREAMRSAIDAFLSSQNWWFKCSDILPDLIEDTCTMHGGLRRSDDCIVLYADEHDHWDDDGPHISSAFLLEYDGGTLEWMYRIDRAGGLERCSSHGGPIPTHWMPLRLPKTKTTPTPVASA